jgi:hypothetical protein
MKTLVDFLLTKDKDMSFELALKDFYSEEMGIPMAIVDLMFVFDCLRLIATGMSNPRICEETGMVIEEVEFIAEWWYGFHGWVDDLDINPLVWYDKERNEQTKRIVALYKYYEGMLATFWR